MTATQPHESSTERFVMANTGPQTQRIDAPRPGRYRLVPDRSSVAFRTRHLFGLAAVSGTMRVLSGTIVVDPTVPEASVEATVSASSFSSGSKRRDRDVRRARFLHAAEHPELTFMAGVLEQAHGRWTLDGELTVRGVSHPVTLAIDSVETTGQGLRARATTRIDRYAFGLTAAKGMAARHLDVELTVAAEPA